MSADLITAVSPPPPGIYRFQVASATEAVRSIQQRLGPAARVIEVRPCARPGWRRWLTAPRYEVVAELPSLTSTREIRSEPAPEPARGASWHDVLRRAGFAERLLGRLEARTDWRKLRDAPLHRALAELGREFERVASRPVPALPARTAFLGQAGVGRTTALCKWLSHPAVAAGPRDVVWRVEFEHPNHTQQLDVYCEALGVPAEHYVPGLSCAGPEERLWADMPALPEGAGRESRALEDFLTRERITGRVLVLNAAYAPDALRTAHARGCRWGITHLVFTHLDEVARWGHLADFLLETEVPCLFLGLGPSLSGEVETQAAAAVARRAFRLLHETREEAA